MTSPVRPLRASDLDVLGRMRSLTPQQRRALREAAGVSRTEAARAVGVSRPGLQKWELPAPSGRMPTGPHALPYARLLHRWSKAQQVGSVAS